MIFLLIPVYCIAGVLLAMFPKWHMDDAYISFRYAAHFAAHAGLTFNPGVTPPVEGYTGVLWTVLMGEIIRAGFSPLKASHGIGVAAFFGALTLLAYLLQRMRFTRLTIAACLMIYATAPIFYVHALSGLETSLYVFIVTACFFAFWEILQRPAPSWRWPVLFVFLSAASFTRPEGVLLMLLIATGTVLFLLRRAPGPALGFIVLSAALLIAPQAVYVFWKFHYYGYLLPNTFYAKKFSGVVSPEAAIGMSKMLTKYFVYPWSFIVLTFLYKPAEFKAQLKHVLAQRGEVAPFMTTLGLFIGVTFVQYSRSNLQMGLSHRFFAPFFPLLLVITAYGLEPSISLWRKWRAEAPRVWQRFVAAGIILTLTQAGVLAFAYQRERLYYQTYMDWLNQTHVRAGKLLHQILPTTAWLATINDAGACPYYSDLRVVDFGRLCDAYLAHHGNLSDSEKADYLFSFRPAAVMITNGYYGDETPSFFTQDPRYAGYTLVHRYGRELFPSEYLYLRKDVLGDVCKIVRRPDVSTETRAHTGDLIGLCQREPPSSAS